MEDTEFDIGVEGLFGKVLDWLINKGEYPLELLKLPRQARHLDTLS